MERWTKIKRKREKKKGKEEGKKRICKILRLKRSRNNRNSQKPTSSEVRVRNSVTKVCSLRDSYQAWRWWALLRWKDLGEGGREGGSKGE